MKKRLLIGLTALTLISGPSLAETKCEVGQMVALPVTMVGLRPEVHAKINGKDVIFTADSGAWYSMISPGNATELGLKLRPLPLGFRVIGIGGSFMPQVTTVDTFTIAGVPVPKLEFIVGGSEVGSVGLLGQNVLAVADTEFDLANGMIRLMRSRNCSKASLAYWAPAGGTYSMLETEQMALERPHIVASISINGTKLRATFDTGSPISFVSLKAAARVGLTPNGANVVSAGMRGGLGRSLISTWVGSVADIKIGDEEIKNTRLRFGGELPDSDMLLGADFFLSHHLYWSNAIHKLFFTFNGGHVFDLRYLGRQETAMGESGKTRSGAVANAVGLEPTDAETLSRRGAVRVVRGDTAGASADFDQAIKLAPDNIDYLRQRAQFRVRMRQPLQAVEDIDRLLKLKPDDVDALMMRAEMRLRFDHEADIRSDVDAAAGAAAKSSDHRLDLAELYEAIQDYPKAIAQYDLWIGSHPDDNRKPLALNGRCWSRAMAGIEMDRALKDCNAALAPNAHQPSYLDSRGMVRLRMGDYAHAVADYDEALKAAPNVAWSHYGRGLAELKLGRKADGEADITKAKSLSANIEEEAKKRGITP